jgi:class 3 adenylate cyclase/tetratricopeptide (TPR) repeat protein
MKCSKCGFENADGLKFCNECGQKLTIACPSCQANNQPGSKFCGDCGNDLTQPSPAIPKDLSFDEKFAKLQKYLPSGITEKILSQRDRIEGEKKQVTVLFCDMKGFTPLSEQLGPETMYAMMDEVYEILIHKVHEYEGTVNEMTGDGVMALFGAPIALEDAPQRAIRTAIAIHKEMTRFNERMRQEKGEFPLVKMRVGIHTGPVVVGTLGNDLRVEFKAVGDTVNLASRMESLAEPGTTYISEDTFKITEGLFRVEALGEKEIKGKEKPLKVYQVIALSSRRTRFDVSAERGLTPFVGRQRELELLLDGFERSREGRGQAISIISEAGIGKSRLLYEFRKAVTNEDVIFLEGRCLSYSRNVAYHPIVDILKANFEIQDDDTGQQTRQKVISFLKFIKVDEPSTLPYLLELLSVKESGIEKMQMSPEARKDRTLEALKRITLKGSEVRPLIMAVEDLHWMDRSSEDALKQLLESISGSRIFLIFTYRPEFVHTWGSRSYHSQVTLNRLSNRECLAMIAHVLTTRNIDRNLEDLILQKAEGIPFFIEEFIKSLRELKIIEKSNGTYILNKDLKAIAIPSTIQDVIMARVDHLPEGAREVLRTGSVIEREFSHELIRKVTGLPEQELLSHLSTLRDSELLYERGIYPNSTYIFKHALTREVVYDSILTKKRKQIHEKIAHAIEEIFGDNICDCYGVLANHCMACEDYEKGAEYARLEARKYQKAGLFRDAIEYMKKSVSCLEKLSDTELNQKRIIDARAALGLYIGQMMHFGEAKEVIDPAVEQAIRLDYRKRLPALFTIVGAHYFWVEEDFSRAFEYLTNAIKISEEVEDFISFVLANLWSSTARVVNCEFELALACLRKALDVCSAGNNLMGISTIKSNISCCNGFYGKIKPAYESGVDAVKTAEKSGDIFSKPLAYTILGFINFTQGLLDEAEKNLLAGKDFSCRINLFWWSAFADFNLGRTYFEAGKYKISYDHCLEAVSALEHIRITPSFVNLLRILAARSEVMLAGKTDLDKVYKWFHENNYRLYDGWMPRYIADILLRMDGNHIPEAESWIKKAIEANTENGMMLELAKSNALYADWFKKKRDIPGAKEQLTKAINLFRECGADGWVTRTEQKLASLA